MPKVVNPGQRAVADQVTITGLGTPSSPFVATQGNVTGWPLTWWTSPTAGGVGGELFAQTANKIELWGLTIPCPVQLNSIIVQVATLDAVGLYDVGLYNSAGVLAAHVGPTVFGATGVTTTAIIGGPVTLTPGRYYWATTGNANTAAYTSSINAASCYLFVRSSNFGASIGGALPSTIVPPAQSVNTNEFPVFALSI